MKIVVELKGINNSNADIYDEFGSLVHANCYFPNNISTYTDVNDSRLFKGTVKETTDINSKVSLNTLLKLKDAGFDSNEICRMYEAGII